MINFLSDFRKLKYSTPTFQFLNWKCWFQSKFWLKLFSLLNCRMHFSICIELQEKFLVDITWAILRTIFETISTYKDTKTEMIWIIWPILHQYYLQLQQFTFWNWKIMINSSASWNCSEKFLYTKFTYRSTCILLLSGMSY